MSAPSSGFILTVPATSSMQVAPRAPSTLSPLPVQVQTEESQIKHICKPILHIDPAGSFFVCGKCGYVNPEWQEQLANMITSNDDARKAALEDHNISAADLIQENGSQHGYKSKGNTGICFELGNPRAKDYAGKRVKVPMLSSAYGTAQFIDRNGYFTTLPNGKIKFKIDYTADKWLIASKQRLYQILNDRQRDIVQRSAAGAVQKKIYSTLVVGILPELSAMLADYHANIYNREDHFKGETEKVINELMQEFRSFIWSLISSESAQ